MSDYRSKMQQLLSVEGSTFTATYVPLGDKSMTIIWTPAPEVGVSSHRVRPFYEGDDSE